MKYNITATNGQKFETEDPIEAYAFFFAEANHIKDEDYAAFAKYCSGVALEWDFGPVPYGNLFDYIAYRWRKDALPDSMQQLIEEFADDDGNYIVEDNDVDVPPDSRNSCVSSGRDYEGDGDVDNIGCDVEDVFCGSIDIYGADTNFDFGDDDDEDW